MIDLNRIENLAYGITEIVPGQKLTFQEQNFITEVCNRDTMLELVRMAKASTTRSSNSDVKLITAGLVALGGLINAPHCTWHTQVLALALEDAGVDCRYIDQFLKDKQ